MVAPSILQIENTEFCPAVMHDIELIVRDIIANPWSSHAYDVGFILIDNRASPRKAQEQVERAFRLAKKTYPKGVTLIVKYFDLQGNRLGRTLNGTILSFNDCE